MELFLRIDINIIAAILLGIVWIISSKRLDRNDSLNAAFLNAGLIIIVELMIESATCIINKRPERWLIPLSNVLHIFLFTLAPILSYCWYSLLKNLINPKKKKNKIKIVILLIPVIVNTILTILSPMYHLIYYIDYNNVYRRGPLFYVFAISTYLYFLVSFIYIIRFKKIIFNREISLFIIFSILPMIGGLIQSLFYGALLMWSSVAFSFILAYVFLQQRMIHVDYLTGAWDRGSFEYYMETRLRRNEPLMTGLIYIDVDDLKKINDQYGHTQGDLAIKEVIVCIRKVLRKTDTIVRMGGDEFVIILSCELQEEIDTIIRKMEDSILVYNKNSGKKYQVSCSFGGTIFDSTKCSMEDALNEIDQMMYLNKSLKKKEL